jgi:Uma2 family endonuclease
MTAVTTQLQTPHPKRWTKREYNNAVESGWFRGTRIHLYRGELIEMPPQGHLHVKSISQGARLLNETFDNRRYSVRIQAPIEVPGESMPEPDLAVCTLQQAKRLPHPAKAELIIEVSDTSLAYDRLKSFDYAAAGVPDYWIADVNARAVEVLRDRVADASSDTGFRYASSQKLVEGQTIAPLAMPNVSIAVADLMP